MRRCWRRGGCRMSRYMDHAKMLSDATKALYTRSSILLTIRSHLPCPLTCQYWQVQFRSFTWWTSVAATPFAQYRQQRCNSARTLLPIWLYVYIPSCALLLRPLLRPLHTLYLYLCSLRIHIGSISRTDPSVGALPAPFQEAGRYCFHSLVL